MRYSALGVPVGYRRRNRPAVGCLPFGYSAMNDHFLIPWERRRKVPWTGLDVLALFLLYIVLMQCCVGLVRLPESSVPGAVPTTEHPLTQLVKQGQGLTIVWFVVFFGAVIAAPLGEEFFFRLVLQGWLEKHESPPFRWKILPHGAVSVVFVSLLFAVLHGGGRTEHSADTLLLLVLGCAIANVCFTVLGVVFLRLRNATWSDLGLRFHRLPSDFGWAALFFVLFVPPIICIHLAAQSLFPGTVTDPIPLFFFAVVLGFLFYRTRRLAGCVLLHAMLNGYSLMVAG